MKRLKVNRKGTHKMAENQKGSKHSTKPITEEEEKNAYTFIPRPFSHPSSSQCPTAMRSWTEAPAEGAEMHPAEQGIDQRQE